MKTMAEEGAKVKKRFAANSFEQNNN